MAYTDIDKPDDYFNTVLYTGNATIRSITGVGFQPDWVWIKRRSTADNHVISDSVRGANKQLFSNLTQSELSATTQITSFDSDGFGLGTDAGVNGSGSTYVAWNWLAANGTASNTNGSITSTVSANTTAGFSIVTYTGTGANATVGHGLGVAPAMVIVKNRAINSDWAVQSSSLTSYAYALIFSGTNAETSAANWWNSTAPTSTTFSIGNGSIAISGNGNSHVAYCFAEKKGFSKFGKYTGNGSLDGTFVYTGFKPAFVIIKRIDSTGSWVVEDSVRSPSNSSMKVLYPNLNNVEETLDPYFDLLSNGFKIRWTSTFINASGGTYIYMAFAENPFVTSTGIPACAR